MDTVKLDENKVKELFDTCETQGLVLFELLKMIYPDIEDWGPDVRLDGWPEANDYTNDTLYKLFIEYDKNHHPEVISGGLWMNRGFAYSDEKLEDWEVIPVEAVVDGND
jgi:hypothetical protein